MAVAVDVPILSSLHQNLQAELIDFPNKPWNFHEKVEWLQRVDGRIAAVKKAADQALQEIEADLLSRPIYDLEWIKALFGCGICAARKKEVDEGRRQTERAVDQAFCGFAKDVAAAGNEKTADVVNGCRLVLQHRPREVQVVLALGERFLKEGVYNQAELLFREVIKLTSSSTTTLHLVEALLRQSKYQEASDAIAAWTTKHAAEKKQYGAQFEAKRVEALIGLERFDDALKALFDLIRMSPNDEGLKRRVVEVAVKKEIKKYLALGQLDGACSSFMNQPRKLYGQLENYAPLQWSAETERSDLDFWLWLLFSQTEIVKKKSLRDLSVLRFKECIQANMLPAELVVKAVGEFIQNVQQQHIEFSKEFKTLLIEGSSSGGIQEVFEGKKKKLMQRYQGSATSVGLEPARAIGFELLTFLKLHPQFKEGSLQVAIASSEMSLKSAENECRLWSETTKKQRHRLPAAMSVTRLLA